MSPRRRLLEVSGVLTPAGCRRLRVLGLLLVVGFGGVIWRLVELQLRQHEMLSELAQEIRQSTQVQVGLRGKILDRRGTLLAVSEPVKTVVGDPHVAGTNYLMLARVLHPLLEMEEAHLAELLRPRQRPNRQGKPVPVQYVVLRRKVPVATWLRMDQTLRTIPSGLAKSGSSRAQREREHRWRQSLLKAVRVEAVDDQQRYYPCGSLAAHVVGLAGRDDAEGDSRLGFDVVGREGVELAMNQALQGARGWVELERVMRDGRAILTPGDLVPSRPGLNVVLTLDAQLQRIVESELELAWERHNPKSITCVVVRPGTGEILALANLPNFDPNHPGGREEADARRNRAVTDAYEPGSTFKVVTISGALDAGVVGLDELVDCEQGRFSYRGVRLGDVHALGLLPVQMVVAKSSNIGAAKVGIRMGNTLLYESIRRFGLGEPTGIQLPGEIRGTVHPTNRWSKISVAWIPMGHEVTATPIQMTMAISAVANRGRLMRPLLVKQIEDDGGRVIAAAQPLIRRQVIREETAAKMVGALRKAVEEGTGVRAQLEHYPVAGKTGTAQKVVNGAYVHDRHFASFIGFFPADDPQLCIGVFIDEPQRGRYGGETAAPIFQAIAGQAASYLAIPMSEPRLESRLSSGEALVRQEPPVRGGLAGAGSRP